MRRFDIAIVSIVTGILVLGLVAISWQTVRSAEDVLLPALDSKAQSVARSVAGLGTEAVGYGIPVDRFVAADEVLRAALDENADFAFATIFNADGEIVAQATRGQAGGFDGADEAEIIMVSAPIEAADGEVAGEVMIGTPRVEARVFSWRQTSMPETLGSIQSSRMMSGAASSTSISASSPFSALVTAKPSASRL